MALRLPAIMRTTAARLSALYFILFALCAILLVHYMTSLSASILTAQTMETINEEVQGLDRAYRRGGWRQGLTMHTCFMNLLPYLRPLDRPRALFHGLSAVASETFGSAPRFQLESLPGPQKDLHSGQLGGTVHNPIQALAEILAQLHGPDALEDVQFFEQILFLGGLEG